MQAPVLTETMKMNLVFHAEAGWREKHSFSVARLT